MPNENTLRCLLPAAFRSSQQDRVHPVDSVYLPTDSTSETRRITPLAYRKYSYR